ncbi:hypothetical protein [Lutibacter sp.]|uniref:hypothetical protein n=1 Tax=Lutibacter sp. TaxID=1925666 RepID=UPI002733DAA0|nr:hypothetical protein [Lutibacter sp.]MDP3313891.1 hypothetical protein [Lutibacter sp.]
MLLFWLSIGILIFYAGIVPIYVMIEFLNYKGIFKYILVALNVIMLSCFSIGFIVTKKEYNK